MPSRKDKVRGMETKSKLLTAKELAAHLDVSIHTLRRYVVEENLPVLRLGRRLVRFSAASVEEWLKRHEKLDAA